MQRIYAAILLLIMLLNMPPFNQLGKIPFMVSHFRVHQQQDPGMTLGKFISLHYFQCDALAKDNKEHKQLPFRTVDPGSHIVSLTPPVFSNLPAQQIAISARTLSKYKEQYIPNPVLLNTFRPPRV